MIKYLSFHMTYESLGPKIEKTDAEKIELISQQTWDKRKLDTNTIILKYELYAVDALVILLFIVLIISFYMIFEFPLSVIITIILLIALIFILSIGWLLYKQATAIGYKLESGKVYKLNEDMTGGIEGKILITRGLFRKDTITLPVNEFDRVTVYQDLIGKYMNFGTIVLKQIDELQNTHDTKLSYVKDPHKAGEIIQRMIDLSKQKPS